MCWCRILQWKLLGGRMSSVMPTSRGRSFASHGPLWATCGHPGCLAGRKRRPLARNGRLGYPGRVCQQEQRERCERSIVAITWHVSKIGTFSAHLHLDHAGQGRRGAARGGPSSASTKVGRTTVWSELTDRSHRSQSELAGDQSELRGSSAVRLLLCGSQ